MIKSGDNLARYIASIIDESVKGALYKRSLQEKEAQDAAIAASPTEPAPATPPAPSHASKTMTDDENAMADGDATMDDIVDKLNSIRSGHSFRDEKVKVNMQQYVDSLSAAEKTALFAFLKGIAQIVTGEIPSAEATEPQTPPADIAMTKGPPPPETKHIQPNVIRTQANKAKKTPSSEDTSAPVPIVPKK